MPESDYALSATMLGAEELKRVLSDVAGPALDALKFAINKSAIDIERAARDNAPHKTGTLWNSINAQQNPGHLAQVTANNVEAVIGTNLEYARAQEAGTVGMTINVTNGRMMKSGVRTKPYTFRGNIKPKWFMKRAKESYATQFVDNMEMAIKSIVNYLVKG